MPVYGVIVEFKWVDGFEINVAVEGGAVLISANKEGLLSLANHMIALAQADSRNHIHLDEYNSLEDHSVGLIIERIG